MKANKVKTNGAAQAGTMAGANTAKNIKHPVIKGILIGGGCALGLAAIGIAGYCGYFYGSPKDDLAAGIHDNRPNTGYENIFDNPADNENYYENGSSNNGTNNSKGEANSEEENKAENDPNRQDPIDPDADLSRMLKAYNNTRDELGLGR